MKTFSIITTAAAFFAFIVMAPDAQAQPMCAPAKAQLGNWESERSSPDNPLRWSAKVYCQNGREGEVVKVEGDYFEGIRNRFQVQVSQFNQTGAVFDPDCSFAVDAYCGN